MMHHMVHRALTACSCVHAPAPHAQVLRAVSTWYAHGMHMVSTWYAQVLRAVSAQGGARALYHGFGATLLGAQCVRRVRSAV